MFNKPLALYVCLYDVLKVKYSTSATLNSDDIIVLKDNIVKGGAVVERNRNTRPDEDEYL